MSSFSSWLTDTNRRIYPSACAFSAEPACGGSLGHVSVGAARGGRCSVQAAVRLTSGLEAATVTAEVEAPDFLDTTIRRVGFVPVPRFNTGTSPDELDGWGMVPGLVPDPLFPESHVAIGPGETAVFWISFHVDAEAPAGCVDALVRIRAGEETVAELRAEVEVYGLTLAPRRGFPVTHWFYSDCLLDWYGLEPFEDRYWDIVTPYMEDLKVHGTDVLYVPLFTPPTDGVRRPSQLVRVNSADGAYRFDFTDVGRYLRAGKAAGFERFEWPHLYSQWGALYAIGVYRGQGVDERRLWPEETLGVSDTYAGFLSAFLPEFKRFLESEGVLESSFFHVSDEPHGDEHKTNYVKARDQLKRIAPWMQTMDAVSEIAYGKEGLTDIPVPTIRTVHEYMENGIDCFTYFCCGPRGRYINRLLDTPLPKIRTAGWLFYRFSRRIHGFLHWGYNYWYRSQTRELIDPFTVTDGHRWPGWAYGDTFVVYPGETGPIDSIRWEVFAEGLQDFELLQSAEIDPDDPLLQPLEGFSEFPRGAAWQDAVRQTVGRRGAK